MRVNLINFIQDLRVTKTPKCTGLLAYEDGRRCGLGLAGDEAVALQPEKYRWWHEGDFWKGKTENITMMYFGELDKPDFQYNTIQDFLGITSDESCLIHEANDSGQDFKQIAALVEEEILTKEERELLKSLDQKERLNANGHEVRADNNEEGHTEEGTSVPLSSAGLPF